MGVIKLSDYDNRRAVPNAEYYRILVDCRDLTAHRLLVSFTSMMDRLADKLLDKADHCGVLSETTQLLETRSLVQTNRAYIVSAFEKGLRARIDRRLRGESEDEVVTSEDGQPLALVDHSEVEEVIAVDSFTRSLANSCHDELIALNARVGFLLGEREMETAANPFGPHSLGHAFRDAWHGVDIKSESRVVVLRMMDGGVVGDVNSVYADLNRHLANLNVLPHLSQGNLMRSPTSKRVYGAGHGGAGGAGSEAAGAASENDAAAKAEGDLFEMLRNMFARVQRGGGQAGGGAQGFAGFNNFLPGGWPSGMGLGHQGADGADQNPWSGFGIGGSTDGEQGGGGFGGGGGGVDPQVIASLTRLQQAFGNAGGFGGDGMQGNGAMFGGGGGGGGGGGSLALDQNILRRLTPQDLGRNVDANGAMTIELVAMLFDFVSADRQLPDAIKALLFRLQIPVLKAALLDKEFFSRRTHPARVLVNRYAEAGIAWQVEHGNADPLFVKIHEGVERIQSEFTDELDLFGEVLKDLDAFLADEERRAEQIVQESADDINKRERQEVAALVSDAELDRRINSAQPPDFLAAFLRDKWRAVLCGAYMESGEEGEDWRSALADMDNLLWSVQPKRTNDERKDLVKRLPSMLMRIRTRMSKIEWADEARELFMSELVECHARAVTATLASAPVIAAETPQPLVLPLVNPVGGDGGSGDTDRDQYHELAETMARGMWVEFTEESGVLVFAKLSWVSPLRGKYLFTHRNGLKAFSLTREELAQRFRDDSARPVESEPLLDRAFSDVMSRLSAQATA